MKNLLLTLSLICITHTISAQAEVVPAQNAFWETYLDRSVKMKITNVSAVIKAQCDEYRSLVVSDSGGTVFDAREVDLLRTLSGDIRESRYVAKFNVDVPATEQLLEENERRARDYIEHLPEVQTLPYYLQYSRLELKYEPTTPISIAAQASSLTAISKSLGLRPLPITMLQSANGWVVKVIGKDSVCDLLAGDAHLSFSSRALARLGKENHGQLQRFYSAFETATRDSWEKRTSPIGRATMLGYKMATTVSAISQNQVEQENVVDQLVQKFFTNEFERNDNWAETNGTYFLTVPQFQQVSISITMQK